MQGLFIGYVSAIEVDSNNLTRSGYITPAVDFSKLQEVLVITKTKDDMISDNAKKSKKKSDGKEADKKSGEKDGEESSDSDKEE